MREGIEKRKQKETNKRNLLITVAVLAALFLIIWLLSLMPGGTGTPEP